MTITRSSQPSWSESSTRILDPVSRCRCLIEQPDFPMKPPMSDSWQSMRREEWPTGTNEGGGGVLARSEAVAAEAGEGKRGE